MFSRDFIDKFNTNKKIILKYFNRCTSYNEYLFTYLLNYLLTYLLHEEESFLRS